VQQRLAKYEAQVKRMEQEHAQKVKQWKEREAQFLEEQNRSNEAVDRKKDLYLSKDPDAILDYCDLVVSN
jgi:restriction system protein